MVYNHCFLIKLNKNNKFWNTQFFPNAFISLYALLQISLLELAKNAVSDFTVIILIISGAVSLVLDLAFGKGDNEWIEGAAILFAVAVVVGVTAANDYQKEKQFRELSSLSEDTDVRDPSQQQRNFCLDVIRHKVHRQQRRRLISSQRHRHATFLPSRLI